MSFSHILFAFRKAFTQIPRDAVFSDVSLILPPTVYNNIKLYFTCLKLVEENVAMLTFKLETLVGGGKNEIPS